MDAIQPRSSANLAKSIESFLDQNNSFIFGVFLSTQDIKKNTLKWLYWKFF